MIADEHDRRRHICSTGWRRCLRNHAAFCDFAHHTSPVDLKAQHGPASLVNGRNWAYSRDVLVAGKRLRDGRREITTVSSKSVGLLVILRHSKPAISQILDACRSSKCFWSKTRRFENISRQRRCRESRPSSNGCTRMFSKYPSSGE